MLTPRRGRQVGSSWRLGTPLNHYQKYTTSAAFGRRTAALEGGSFGHPAKRMASAPIGHGGSVLSLIHDIVLRSCRIQTVGQTTLSIRQGSPQAIPSA